MAEDVSYRRIVEAYSRKNTIQKLLRKVGVAAFRFRKGYIYCPPKYIAKSLKIVDIKADSEFSRAARPVMAQKTTTLDRERLYTIYQAVQNARRLSNGNVQMAEVGVYKGGGTYFVASIVEQLFENKPTIHAFDTFEGHFREDLSPNLDGPHDQPGKFQDTSFEAVQTYLSPFPNVVLHKGRFQERSVAVSEETFAFAHLDVDIYAPTLFCLEFFAKRLITGGMLVVDDYGFKTCEGAKQAVDEFTETRTDFLKFQIESGQCLLVKVV
jgi:hypothetical protein